MKVCVIDASVIAAAFFQEDHAESAQALLTGKRQLHAPDLIYAEAANAFWKYVAAGTLDLDTAQRGLREVAGMVGEVVPSDQLAGEVLELAAQLRKPVYDLFYLVLARQQSGVLVSFDRRLSELARRLGVATAV